MSQKRLIMLNPKMNGYVRHKRKAKLTRKSVLKMLAVMEASQNKEPPADPSQSAPPPTPDTEDGRPQDFLQSGRTGRRNALANILGEHAVVTSSDLPSQLEGLSTKDKVDESQKPNDAGCSKS